MKRAHLGAGVVLLVLALGPVPDPAMTPALAGEKGKGPTVERDECIYAMRGSPAERALEARTRNAKGGSGKGKPKGGPKGAPCAKTFARWDTATIAVCVDDANAPASVPPGALSSLAGHALVEWSCHSGLGADENVEILVVASPGEADVTIGWGDLGSSGILGQAVTTHAAGVILRSEVTMNGNQTAFLWTTGSDPDVDDGGCAVEAPNGDGLSGRYDLLSVLVHEVGHALGVSHPNKRCRSGDKCYAETMFSCTGPEEFMRRALDPGDQAAISALYGPDA